MSTGKPARAPRRAKRFDSEAAPRNRSRIPVEVHVAGRIERAAIADLSPSGARIVGPMLALEPGTPLEIRYKAVAGVAPKPVHAEFVRATEDGFAVRILRG